MRKVGEVIKELREENNISQKTLAKAIGVGQATISEWENGIYEPTASAIRAIAKFFNITTDFLLQVND